MDLDLPYQQLIVLCGLSGSGKSSLAMDTIYAEGQRRYIESFSPYTRQFLEKLEKPTSDRIDGIPPAIAVTAKPTNHMSRSTVGTATETADYLRLLFSKLGTVFCKECGKEVRCDSPESIARHLHSLPEGIRFMVAFTPEIGVLPEDPAILELEWKEGGFLRGIVGEHQFHLDQGGFPESIRKSWASWRESNGEQSHPIFLILDRLTTGKSSEARLRESVESALDYGDGRCWIFAEPNAASDLNESSGAIRLGKSYSIEGKNWILTGFSRRLRCEDCDMEYPRLEPKLFSFNSPLGACPTCEGFGNLMGLDLELIIPDRTKSIRDGAIAPWNSPSYRHKLEELLEVAESMGVPVDVPFSKLTEAQVAKVVQGDAEAKYSGLDAFFEQLQRRKYKMHIRVFLSRWRSYRPCPTCRGARLRQEALAVKIGGKNIAELSAMKIADALVFLDQLPLSSWERKVAATSLEQVHARLGYLQEVGLDYLTLDRSIRTLSGGEQRRVGLTSALGSSLVNMLYVLDEPSIGLHPSDTDRLLESILKLRDRGNTVVVVEHEEAILRRADRLIEIGPEAGEAGGYIVFEGTPEEIEKDEESLTGSYLSGRRGGGVPAKRRQVEHGLIELFGAAGHNLQKLDVSFPMGMLCLVTGVSGSGKSTLVEETLHPALCHKMGKDSEKALPHDKVLGSGQIDDVVMVDQGPIGRSPRSNPVTYLKIFDEIRNVFADTLEARTRNYHPGYFSFNVDGGRCNTCKGDGFIAIDMQFMADVYMNCPQCNGKRYQREILEITYRGRNIAEVLDMTVREAFGFFRGKSKVQAKLKRLIDVGLDYVRLGQPANTLSGGESQRLKLAAYLSNIKRGRCLFILDEPTTGLHYADVVQLLDCFDALVKMGHSLIVIEHNLQMMKAADYIIDLGPGAAEAGGRIVVEGPPEKVAKCKHSVTGRFLAEALRRKQQVQA